MSLHIQKLIRLIIIGLYSALVFALKEALAILPNIEVVSFLLSFAALVFPFRMAIAIPLIFNLCEIFLRGIATWVILYMVAWPLLVIIIWSFKKIIKKYWWLFIIINSLWGFSFGTLDAFIHLFLYGKADFYLYWLNSLPFDAIHGVSNIVVSSVLYKPTLYLWNLRLKYYIIDFNDEKELPKKLKWKLFNHPKKCFECKKIIENDEDVVEIKKRLKKIHYQCWIANIEKYKCNPIPTIESLAI